MSHASLSSTDRQDARGAIGSEAALWLFGLTALSLVFASVLLLSMLSRSSFGNAALDGFMTAMAIVIAGIGVAAAVYVVAVVRRAGYLDSTDETTPAPWVEEPAATTGLHIAPTVPADLAPSRRHKLATERAVRSKQAQAIAAIAVVSSTPGPVRAPAQTQRPAATAAPTPARTVVPARPPAAARPATPSGRPAPSRPPAPVQPVAAARPMAPVRQPVPARRPVPARPPAPPRPPAGAPPPAQRAAPAPRPAVRPPRPVMTPVLPHLPVPSIRPRTQVALTQIASAGVRSGWMSPNARPLPPAVRV